MNFPQAIKQSVSDWALSEDVFDEDRAAHTETLFSIGNGYVGVRGYFDEGYGNSLKNTASSTYINGVYESLDIHYDEGAHGFAKNCHRIVNLPSLEYSVELDGVTFCMGSGRVLGYSRVLDFKTGVLSREYKWEAPNGKQLNLKFERLALFECKHIVAARLSVAALNFNGEVSVTAKLNAHSKHQSDSDDPREGGGIPAENWRALHNSQRGNTSQFLHQTLNSGFQVASTMQCKISSPGSTNAECSSEALIQQALLNLRESLVVQYETVISYVDSRNGLTGESLLELGDAMCGDYAELGFDDLVAKQKKVLVQFWRSADIIVDSDDSAQFATRFSLFHLLQSTGNDGKSSVAAKGLTGGGYDGHYFWDSEVYVFPFWLFNEPSRAKNLLKYRISTLSEARKRARQMGHEKGALFAWRTIGGEECSSYFPAGSAQYHINSDIAYAARSYIQMTGDREFLGEGLAELVLETARIWVSLGHFDARNNDEFGIHEVTGPDEYTAMVDNNYYTNKLAKAHLQWASELVVQLKGTDKSFITDLMQRLSLTDSEVDEWARAASAMRLPFDKVLGINEQHDGFLNKPKWDFANTPKNKYPLLLNFHPLAIYRFQVLKQADTVLAHILEGHDVAQDCKRKSYAYYEKITTHDSTLSPCVHGVMASELGDMEQAYDYIIDTLTLDLENKHSNTHYGVHTAAMGGVWMGIVQGFAGLRYSDGQLKLRPKLPERWRRVVFKLQYLGAMIEIELQTDSVNYRLLPGVPKIELFHFNQRVELSFDGKSSVRLPL